MNEHQAAQGLLVYAYKYIIHRAPQSLSSLRIWLWAGRIREFSCSHFTLEKSKKPKELVDLEIKVANTKQTLNQAIQKTW